VKTAPPPRSPLNQFLDADEQEKMAALVAPPPPKIRNNDEEKEAEELGRIRQRQRLEESR